MEQNIAIQGYEGSFHHEAAQHLFGEHIRVIPCNNFRQLVITAEQDPACTAALMAIENSIAGSILPNYNLLQKSRLGITGEIYLQINQHLLANPGVGIDDIREVHSHTMALQQCDEFLAGYPWKLVETDDTALSARHIQHYNSTHMAAVAGRAAASRYGLNILRENIHTQPGNYTRFLLLKKREEILTPEGAGKASVNFQTDHTRGSLAAVLTRIADGGINLSKLQSFPIPGPEFKYSFHADMEFDHEERFQQVIRDIRPLTASLHIYGIYKRGIWK